MDRDLPSCVKLLESLSIDTVGCIDITAPKIVAYAVSAASRPLPILIKFFVSPVVIGSNNTHPTAQKSLYAGVENWHRLTLTFCKTNARDQSGRYV